MISPTQRSLAHLRLDDNALGPGSWAWAAADRPLRLTTLSLWDGGVGPAGASRVKRQISWVAPADSRVTSLTPSAPRHSRASRARGSCNPLTVRT